MSNSVESRPSRWKPRISLLTGLLLLTIAGMAIVIVRLWNEVGPQRVELRRLRDELGVLTIEDSSKLHAIQVQTNDNLQWKWRIWAPDDDEYTLRFKWGEVPKDGFPELDVGCSIEPGENLITLTLQKDRNDGEWKTRVETTSGDGIYRSIREPEPWFLWTINHIDRDGVEFSTEVEPTPKKQFLLQRFRTVDDELKAKGLDPTKSDELLPGFLIWVERTALTPSTPSNSGNSP